MRCIAPLSWLAVLLALCACRTPDATDAPTEAPNWTTTQAHARRPTLTPGNILKHQNTEVVEVANLQLVDENAPRLSFRGSVGGLAQDLETDGYDVQVRTTAGNGFQRENRYLVFFNRKGLLRVRRMRPASFPAEIEPLLDGAKVHTPVGAPSTFVTFFDLRKDQSVRKGPLVLPIDTRIAAGAAERTTDGAAPAADPPKKRLFRIDVDVLEQKLGTALAQVAVGGAPIAAVEPIGPRRTAGGDLVWQFRATWQDPGGQRHTRALQTDGAGPPTDATATLPPADLTTLPYTFTIAAGSIQVRNQDAPPRSVTLPRPIEYGGAATIGTVRAYPLRSHTLLVVTPVAQGSAPAEVRLWTVANASIEELFDLPTDLR